MVVFFTSVSQMSELGPGEGKEPEEPVSCKGTTVLKPQAADSG